MKLIFNFAFIFITFFAFSKDKGIGILFFSSEPAGKTQVNIYEKNSAGSTVLGAFIREYMGNGQTTYTVQVNNLKEDNLTEYKYETLGLPFCETRGNWVNVIYGYDVSGKVLTGWIEQKNGVTDHLIWREYLKSAMLFFEQTDKISFFDSPNGVNIDFKLQPSPYLVFDYIMKPMDTSGNWMKVEVTTPSDYCNMPKDKVTRVFWIKYLDQNGRPLVWYFTRGC